MTLSRSGPGGGPGTIVLGVPQMPSLLGFAFNFQWVVLDAGSGNGRFTLTGGLAATVQPDRTYAARLREPGAKG